MVFAISAFHSESFSQIRGLVLTRKRRKKEEKNPAECRGSLALSGEGFTSPQAASNFGDALAEKELLFY